MKRRTGSKLLMLFASAALALIADWSQPHDWSDAARAEAVSESGGPLDADHFVAAPVVGPPIGMFPGADSDERVIPLPKVEDDVATQSSVIAPVSVVQAAAAEVPSQLPLDNVHVAPAPNVAEASKSGNNAAIAPPAIFVPRRPMGLDPQYDRQFDQFLRQAATASPLEAEAQQAEQRILQQRQAATAVAMTGSGSRQAPRSAPPAEDMTDDDYLREVRPDLVRPRYLRSPSQLMPPGIPLEEPAEPYELLMLPMEAPLGYTGPSGVMPREGQMSSHFVPMEDRWRIGLPEWDRYGLNHPPLDDYPYTLGREHDPYHQNVIKGDYPIIGQHTFLNVTAQTIDDFEGRQVPTPAHPFEVNPQPHQPDFFGNPNQFFTTDFFVLSADLFHGDAAFKPADWRLKVEGDFDMNYLNVQELGIVSPNVNNGTTRFRTWTTLQEYFAETKLADTSPAYDFMSLRVGAQPFLSDFRGFVYQDVNRAVRLFGTQDANQNQFNFYYVNWLEKETNSGLNTFDNRPKQTAIANFYRQDFIWPGYTMQVSFLYDYDKASLEYDNNGFLVRPDPAGVAAKHSVNSYFIGVNGDGHINRFNITHSFYEVLGRDELNPIAGQKVNINAQMAAAELSYDRDWARFRTSFFYASGDDKPFDGTATGFDTIIDDPNFAGGQFSYWDRQQIKLLGVNLVQGFSLVPDMRSSKIQGQPNYVNPGLYLANIGSDFDVTPKLRLIGNVNWLWFSQPEVLQVFLFQNGIPRFIGTDLSLGFEYRPQLSNNIILVGGVQGLVPGGAFKAIYNPIVGDVGNMFAGFMNLTLRF